MAKYQGNDDTMYIASYSHLSADEAVKQYFVYKNRLEQLKHEVKIANRMFRDAEQCLRENGTIPTEYLQWNSN